jgi:hypothetical protein
MRQHYNIKMNIRDTEFWGIICRCDYAIRHIPISSGSLAVQLKLKAA